jgi:hypothetical protein
MPRLARWPAKPIPLLIAFLIHVLRHASRRVILKGDVLFNSLDPF